MAKPQDSSSNFSRSAFPSTSLNLLRQVKEGTTVSHREAMEELCRRYWRPVYSYIRSFRDCPREEAKDLTQEFFLEVFEGRLIDRYMPDTGSFRAFLRGCLRVFVLHFRRKASAQKRGGQVKLISIGDEDLMRLEIVTVKKDDPPEKHFDRQWANDVLEQAVEDLKNELKRSGKEVYFQVFERYGQRASAEEAPTYAALARELGIKETDVSNYLTGCRRRLRELILDRIREYQAGEDEVAREFLQLFSE